MKDSFIAVFVAWSRRLNLLIKLVLCYLWEGDFFFSLLE